MKLELGKTYKLKNGFVCNIVSQKAFNDDIRFLGVLEGIPETFWYTQTGRLYTDGISPLDIEKEITTKITFNTNIRVENKTIIAGWPKKAIEEFFNNKKVKITVELLND